MYAHRGPLIYNDECGDLFNPMTFPVIGLNRNDKPSIARGDEVNVMLYLRERDEVEAHVECLTSQSLRSQCTLKEWEEDARLVPLVGVGERRV